MIRLSRLLAPCLAIALALPIWGVAALGEDSVTDLIIKADLAYMKRHLQESMAQAMALYEAVLPSFDSLSAWSQAYVLNRLSQLCYEAAMFSDGNTSEDRTLFEKGKAYGLQSIRLDNEFAAREPDGFNEALNCVTDTAALHWTANNWGMLCGMNPIMGLTQQDSVMALFERCVGIDKGFWGAKRRQCAWVTSDNAAGFDGR